MIPEAYKPFINLNPLAPLVVSWRSLFLKGTLEPFYLLISFLYAILIFALGYQVYRKLSWRFAEIL
jgi:lipopolysaccharide transport system permease protein